MRRTAATPAVAVVLASVLAAGLTGCIEASPLVEGSRVTVATTEPITSLAQLALLTGTGFGYRDDSGEFVRDESFGHAEIVHRDPLTVRYTIADGVRWSDGTPVDATDLMLSWAAGSGALAGVEAAPDAGLALVTQPPQLADDPRTMFLHFDSFYAGWESAIAPTLPAHLVAARALGLPVETEAERTAAKTALADAVLDDDAESLEAIAEVSNGSSSIVDTPFQRELFVASGPYLVDEVSADRVVLTANPEYRGEREPSVETIEVRTISDRAALARSAVDGETDVVVAPAGPLLLQELEGASGVDVSVAPGAELEQLQLMLADSRSRAFGDPGIREAFLRTIPRDELAAELAATRLDSFLVPPTAASYADAVAANGSDDFSAPDPDAAASLLAEAGVTGVTVCILYDPDDPARARAFELIRDAAAPAGFRVTDCSTSDWLRMLGRGGAYDAALLSWDPTQLGPGTAEALLGSDSTVANLNRYADPAVDALIDELSASGDPERQAELISELDAAVWASASGLPLYAHPVVTAVGPAVTGVSWSAFGGSVLWNAWTWQPASHTPR